MHRNCGGVFVFLAIKLVWIQGKREGETYLFGCIHLHALLCFFYCILSPTCRRQKMETVKKWNKDFIALNQLDTKIHSKQNGKMIVLKPNQGSVFQKHCNTKIKIKW